MNFGEHMTKGSAGSSSTKTSALTWAEWQQGARHEPAISLLDLARMSCALGRPNRY